LSCVQPRFEISNKFLTDGRHRRGQRFSRHPYNIYYNVKCNSVLLGETAVSATGRHKGANDVRAVCPLHQAVNAVRARTFIFYPIWSDTFSSFLNAEIIKLRSCSSVAVFRIDIESIEWIIGFFLCIRIIISVSSSLAGRRIRAHNIWYKYRYTVVCYGLGLWKKWIYMCASA